MPSNSNEPWGLIVPGRPLTPSEGAAQTYNRVGPIASQKTRTFDNGTCLTFGPLDLVDEFDPIIHPFRDQIAQVDMAIRDCRDNRLRYEGGRIIAAEEDNEGAISADDPFNNFRQVPVQNPQNLSLVYLASGTYVQVPSKHASCQYGISYFAVVNARYQERNPDTRFGVTTKPDTVQPRQFAQSRRGRGGRHVNGGRITPNGQRQIADGRNAPDGNHQAVGIRNASTGPRQGTNSRGIPSGPRRTTDARDFLHGQSEVASFTGGSEDEDVDEHQRAGRGRVDRHRGRTGRLLNGRFPENGNDPQPHVFVPVDIRHKYIRASTIFNRAYRGYRNGRAAQVPAANRIASGAAFNSMYQQRLHDTTSSEELQPQTQNTLGVREVPTRALRRGEENTGTISQAIRDEGSLLAAQVSDELQPAPTTDVSQPAKSHRRKKKRGNKGASIDATDMAHSAPQLTAQSPNMNHGSQQERGGEHPSGDLANEDNHMAVQQPGQTTTNNHDNRATRGGNQAESFNPHNNARPVVKPPIRPFNHNHGTQIRRGGYTQDRGNHHGNMYGAVRPPRQAVSHGRDSRLRPGVDLRDGGYLQGQDDMGSTFQNMPRLEDPFSSEAYGRGPKPYPTYQVRALGYGADGLQDFSHQDQNRGFGAVSPAGHHVPHARVPNPVQFTHEFQGMPETSFGSHMFDTAFAVPNQGMPASYAIPTQFAHGLQGSTLDGPIDQGTRAPLGGERERMQAPANTHYAMLLDEENAMFRRSGEIPFRGNMMSGDAVDQAHFGLGFGIGSNTLDMKSLDKQKSTKASKKQPALDDSWITVDGVTRRMTYKEHFEMQCRRNGVTSSTPASNQTGAEGDIRPKNNTIEGPATRQEFPQFQAEILRSTPDDQASSMTLPVRAPNPRMAALPGRAGQLDMLRHLGITADNATMNASSLPVTPAQSVVDEMDGGMPVGTTQSSPSQNADARTSRFAHFWRDQK